MFIEMIKIVAKRSWPSDHPNSDNLDCRTIVIKIVTVGTFSKGNKKWKKEAEVPAYLKGGANFKCQLWPYISISSAHTFQFQVPIHFMPCIVISSAHAYQFQVPHLISSAHTYNYFKCVGC